MGNHNYSLVNANIEKLEAFNAFRLTLAGLALYILLTEKPKKRFNSFNKRLSSRRYRRSY